MMFIKDTANVPLSLQVVTTLSHSSLLDCMPKTNLCTVNSIKYISSCFALVVMTVVNVKTKI